MSGIFGIFNRNGKVVEKQLVEKMLDSISYWKPDERRKCINNSVALGHAMLWNAPESKYEHLPLEKDAFILTMDARIDNREELVNDLELPNRQLNEIGDSEFILAAYRKWGEDCPKYLLGDFAFAIWDEERQHLFCARDHIGIKVFHYYLSDNLFVFSNDLKGILSHKNVSKKYDEKTISLFLRDKGLHTDRSTFFKKIKKLPPATTLTISRDFIKEKKYWSIEDSPTIIYDTYEEYVQKLKELFDNAVESRLRTVYPIISHLSGGIDSSPIAVLAARKLKKKHQPLYVYNWINIPKNENDYEFESWSFSRRIAEKENIVHKEISVNPKGVAALYDKFDVTTQGTMFYWREYFIQEKAEKIGARTILSGWGGDELISYNGYGYESGLFWQGNFILALKYKYSEKKKNNYSWYRFIRRCGRMILHPLINKWLVHDSDIYDSDDYAYIQKDFKKIMQKYKFQDIKFGTGIKKRQLSLFNHGHLQARIESWAMSAFSKKIEYSYPLLDKRIVEFAMGIPEEMFAVKDDHRRYLWRKSIESLLPYNVVWMPKYAEIKIERTQKRYYKEALRIWFETYCFKKDRLKSNAYIDYDKIVQRMQNFNFEIDDPAELKKVVVAILISNSTNNCK